MFSVVIPLYNKAPHIRAALLSVLSQSLAAAEIIVVDDGSTDGGGELVSEFFGRGVQLIRQANRGVSAARNVGVSAATSAYVAFLDADDAWLPEHLARLQETIEKVPQAGLFSTLHRIQTKTQIFEPRSAYPLGFVGRVDNFFAAMSVGLSLVNSSTACVRRTSFLEIGGFPVGVQRGEDLIVWMKMARSFGMAHTAVSTAIYNRAAVNRSSESLNGNVPASLLYLNELIAGMTPDSIEKRSANLLFEKIAFYTAAGMRASGNIQAVSAIRSVAYEMKLLKLSLKLALLTITPPILLAFARNFRHPRKLSNSEATLKS